MGRKDKAAKLSADSGGRVKTQGISVVSGVLIGYAITCIGFIGCALALTYTSLAESSVSLIVMITSVISVMVAGFDASRGAEKNGWLWGVVAGLIYAIILLFLLFLVQGAFAFDLKKFTLLALSVAGGGMGGIIGINFKK